MSLVRTAICDLDGTLLDSDAALVDAFLRLGIERSSISFGHVIAEECERLGIALFDYVAAYDTHAAQPFPGVTDLITQLGSWAICSNKHPESGNAELARLDWTPSIALFADAFGGAKQLAPVLEALGLEPSQAVFLGDTDHDRRCAQDAGVEFVLAGWNPRATARNGDVVVTSPLDLLELLAD
jgi:HAD superfamily hydrolase (TIGR01549 family)